MTRFKGLLHGNIIRANTMSDLKRKASILSNNVFSACPTMYVWDSQENDIVCTLRRLHPIAPLGQATETTRLVWR